MENFKVYQKFVFNELHGQIARSVNVPDKAKFVVCSIISLALSFWMKHLVIGQLQKPAKFSAFHGQHLEVRLSLVSFWEPAG